MRKVMCNQERAPKYFWGARALLKTALVIIVDVSPVRARAPFLGPARREGPVS